MPVSTHQPKLHINAPEEMYTAPPRRVDHFIAAHEWAIIKNGDGNQLIDYALVAFGAAVGFLQNVYQIVHWEFFSEPESQGRPLVAPQGWDIFGSLICAVFFTAALVFYFSSRKIKSEYVRTVQEIDSRQPMPFHAEESSVADSSLSDGPRRNRSVNQALADAIAQQKK